jgi:hypothetical protein
VDIELIRRIEIINLFVFVVVKASPVEAPTVKPEKVIVPADAPLVTRISIAESAAGDAKV